MRTYIYEICKELEFPTEAAEAMQTAWEQLEETKGAEVYRTIVKEYREDIHRDLKQAMKEADEAAEKAGVHRYTAELLQFLLLAEPLREYYEKRGLPMKIWHDSCMDLHWKLMECRRVYGIWGSFVAWWFPRFFEMTCFALGRFEFELIDFPEEYEEAGLKKPEHMPKVINVHIPSCGKLNREEYLKSYEQAAEFFADAFPGEEIAFVCESWLLFDGHKEMLPADSGIVGFLSDYKCFLQKESDEDLWRIFHKEWDGDAKALPEDTGLQKAYKKLLLEGKKPGFGYGIFFRKK